MRAGIPAIKLFFIVIKGKSSVIFLFSLMQAVRIEREFGPDSEATDHCSVTEVR